MLTALENPYNERTTWQYDALGRVTTMTYGNGAIAEYDYDAASRLTALRNLKADRSVLSIFTYTYDAVGNRTQVEEANGEIVTWSYDEIYQLTREQRSGANSYDITYTYDAVGNRLTKEEGGVVTTYSYDTANQLNYFEDNAGRTTFSYDANGNTSLELRPNGDRITYTWDIENRQTKVELPASVVNTITLDGDGKRRSIEDSAGLRRMVWDGENILTELNNAGATLAAYTLAPEGYGELVSQRRSGATSFHHFDALGSTERLTDNAATTLVQYLYRAFGQQTVLSGSSANRFTWVGKLGYYRQADASDYWVRARIMNSHVGRWRSRDPQLPNLFVSHPYCYCRNQPATCTDPSGLFCWRDFEKCFLCFGAMSCVIGCVTGACAACVGGVIIGCIPAGAGFIACARMGVILCWHLACAPTVKACLIGCLARIAQTIGFCWYKARGECSSCRQRSCTDFLGL